MSSDLQRMQLTQQLDQQTAGLIELAATLAAYLKALMSNGFTRREAMELTTAYQQILFMSAFNGNRPKDH